MNYRDAILTSRCVCNRGLCVFGEEAKIANICVKVFENRNGFTPLSERGFVLENKKLFYFAIESVG